MQKLCTDYCFMSQNKKQCRTEFKSFLKKLCINREEVILAVSDANRSNTYVETINPSIADSLHLDVNKNYPETITTEFFRFAKPLILKQRFGLVNLIADVTEEDFYGKKSSLYIHGWTGERGVVGKFRYLVVAVLFRNQITPFYLAILPIGAFKAEYLGKAVEYAGSLGLKINCLLLDRGFYSGDIINSLQMNNANYLIFVPKNKLMKCMLESVQGDAIIEHEIKYSKDKNLYLAETNIILVRGAEEYDWVFASNIFLQDAGKYISLYKKRWSIETMFRVHDEARIKSKSLKPEIRLFYFAVSMLLLLIWNLYFKTKITFKKFVIENYKQMEQTIEANSR